MRAICNGQRKKRQPTLESECGFQSRTKGEKDRKSVRKERGDITIRVIMMLGLYG